jgi:hypothetical protein
MKNVYNFSAVTREYLSTDEAHRDPLEPEKYVLPANSTFNAPPSVLLNEVAVFDENGDWAVMPDFRGETYYKIDDGESLVIDFIGDLPKNLTKESRPDKYHVFKDGNWAMTEEMAEKKRKDCVPEFITIMQCHLMLNALGLNDKVEKFLDEQATAEQKIKWKYATEVDRSSDFGDAFMQVAGVTDIEVDNFFIAAKNL